MTRIEPFNCVFTIDLIKLVTKKNVDCVQGHKAWVTIHMWPIRTNWAIWPWPVPPVSSTRTPQTEGNLTAVKVDTESTKRFGQKTCNGDENIVKVSSRRKTAVDVGDEHPSAWKQRHLSKPMVWCLDMTRLIRWTVNARSRLYSANVYRWITLLSHPMARQTISRRVVDRSAAGDKRQTVRAGSELWAGPGRRDAWPLVR